MLLSKLRAITDMDFESLLQQCSLYSLPVVTTCDRTGLVALVRQGCKWSHMCARALKHECVRLEVPIDRLRDGASARRLLFIMQQINDLGTESPKLLLSLCQEWGLAVAPSEPLTTCETLKQVARWRAMPLSELIYDCRVRSVSTALPPASGELFVDSGRDQVVQALIDSLSGSDDSHRRTLLSRLQSADHLRRLEQRMKHWDTLGLASLRRECHASGIKCYLEQSWCTLRQQLYDVFLWEALPVLTLQREVTTAGIIVSSQHKRIPCRKMLVDALVRVLNQRNYAESKGIPVHALSDSCIANLLSKREEFAHMTSTALDAWLESTGFPRSPETTDADLRHLLNEVTLWFALPTAELQRQCLERDLPVDGEAVAKYGNGLVDMLFYDEQTILWEAQGWRARSGGAVPAAGIIIKYNELAQSDAALKNAYVESGLPPDASLEKGSMLHILKQMMIWGILSVTELEAECSARGVSSEELKLISDQPMEERCSLLNFILILEMCASSYEANGVPVRRLGMIQALRVVGQLDRLKGMSSEDLLKAYGEYGMPTVTPTPELEELRRRMCDLTVWLGLPIDELWLECEYWLVMLDGFDGFSLSAEHEEDVLRRQLVDRLLVRSCILRADAAIAPSSTAGAVGCSTLCHSRPNAHRYVEQMRDATIAHRICGVTKERKPVLQPLPATAEAWSEVEVALYCVSGGVFNPELHRRDPVSVERAETLVSVICPTTDKRQHFHELLYRCFQMQEYENKELIVVDTGKKPSPFFESMVKSDNRIIYRHFDVEDSQWYDEAKPVQVAWTLGLKRNIACCLAHGAAIAHFDDDDLYSPGYLSFMWAKLLEAADCNLDAVPAPLPAVVVKLSEWHLLDIHDMSFRRLNVGRADSVPATERRNWLYGWGFSYFFSKTAWELVPVPDVEFAEDLGFIEHLLAKGVPVEL
eukprot:6479111-Amphidinium_carterae.1